MKDLITPREILIEEYLNPMGISQNAMARDIGVSPRAINEIVLGRRSITPPMSIRFGVFFGSEPAVRHRRHQGLGVLRLEDIVRFLQGPGPEGRVKIAHANGCPGLQPFSRQARTTISFTCS